MPQRTLRIGTYPTLLSHDTVLCHTTPHLTALRFTIPHQTTSPQLNPPLYAADKSIHAMCTALSAQLTTLYAAVKSIHANMYSSFSHKTNCVIAG